MSARGENEGREQQQHVSMRRYNGVLSDADIKYGLSVGDVVIEPLCMQNLSANSYDTTLGAFYFASNNSHLPSFIGVENAQQLAQYWNASSSASNYGALKARTIITAADAKTYGVAINDEIIVIQPGNTILGHTQEFIGGQNCVTSQVCAKSSTGRACITVCADACFSEISYINRLTLEIRNCSLCPVVLRVGSKLAKVIFHASSKPDMDYNTTSSYQASNNVEELKTMWRPQDILPSVVVKHLKTQEKDKELKNMTSITKQLTSL